VGVDVRWAARRGADAAPGLAHAVSEKALAAAKTSPSCQVLFLLGGHAPQQGEVLPVHPATQPALWPLAEAIDMLHEEAWSACSPATNRHAEACAVAVRAGASRSGARSKALLVIADRHPAAHRTQRRHLPQDALEHYDVSLGRGSARSPARCSASPPGRHQRPHHDATLAGVEMGLKYGVRTSRRACARPWTISPRRLGHEAIDSRSI